MESTSKSNELLARLRSVTLEDELNLTDFWPTEKSRTETSQKSSFTADSLNSYNPSWEDTDLTLRSGTCLEPGRKMETLPKSLSEKTAPKSESTLEDFSSRSLSRSDSFENRENPFAKMAWKSANLTSKLSKKMKGWLLSTSWFGILGIVCGGSLTAWSLLVKSGSHSMTSLGLSLVISGILMLVWAGICQTVLHTSGQT